MFPHEQEGREGFNGRPSLLPPRLPRLHSHPGGLGAAGSPEAHSEDDYNSLARADSGPERPHYRSFRGRHRGRSFEEEEARLHTMLPSVASLMPPSRHGEELRPRHESAFDTDARRQQPQHLPELSYERRRAQTLPQVYGGASSAAASLSGLAAFAAPQLIEMRGSRYGASPSNRPSRWSPYAPVPVAAGRTVVGELPGGDAENEGAQSNRRRRTSPRRRLAASKARARALQMAMEGEQAGLVGRFETEHAGYRERNYGPAFQPPATSFGFSLPKPLRPTTADTSPKSSRYLREIDRRTILARLDQGEKQSALAKEFRVTRAAICNLNKHRELVLSRQHEDPLAKHPKKARRRRDAGDEAEAALSRGDGSNRISQLLSDASPTHYENSTLHLVALQPAERLIPLLLSSETSNAAFRRYCDCLMTLVVEEVLAWTHTETSNTRHAPTPCGVSIAPGGSRMLSVFQALEPELPTGQIELRLPQFGSVVDLPAAVASHNVCLFYAFTDTAGGVRVAKGIRELLDRGAVEELLCLVTLAVSALTVGELQRAHPSLRIAAAHVESHEDDERLHHTENEPYEASRPTSRLQLLATRAAEMY